jgi:hypothetical protein
MNMILLSAHLCDWLLFGACVLEICHKLYKFNYVYMNPRVEFLVVFRKLLIFTHQLIFTRS